MNKDAVLKKLNQSRLKSRFSVDVPMSAHTSFRIGGPADVLFQPACAEDITWVRTFCAREGVPFTILGHGTNTLVLDGGLRGVVLWLGDGCLNHIADVGGGILAGAGVVTAEAARFACGAGYSGLEFACGIPGSVGGAVCMNAGAYGAEMKDVVRRTTYLDADGQTHVVEAADHAFAYRGSVFQENGGVILATELALTPGGDHKRIWEQMEAYRSRREQSQPLDAPSAGSVFRRPPGMFVGPMIESCGLKGFRIGGVQVSPKHAGFIVNTGGATADDVLRLIAHIQEKVAARFSVTLQPEIRIIGAP